MTIIERSLDFVREQTSLPNFMNNFPTYFMWWIIIVADYLEATNAEDFTEKQIEYIKGLIDLMSDNVSKNLLKRLLKQEITVESSKSVLGLKYFAVGLNDEEQKKLIAGGVSGFSTFMSYYILKAIASFDKDKAVEMLKEYYGAMLKKGATTFWEDFDIRWAENSCRIDEFPKAGEKDIHGDHGAHCYLGFRHSLCHGWSAGVIKFIKDEIYKKVENKN